jgi:hypothetical protein
MVIDHCEKPLSRFATRFYNVGPFATSIHARKSAAKRKSPLLSGLSSSIDIDGFPNGGGAGT